MPLSTKSIEIPNKGFLEQFKESEKNWRNYRHLEWLYINLCLMAIDLSLNVD